MSASSQQDPQRTHCQNCGTELKGPYCHKCGQQDFDFHQSWSHVVHETLESFFHFDGKFFRGIYDLLFKPGWLTKAFNEGKRAGQIPPLRFYIFVSLLFFLAPSGPTESSKPTIRPNFDLNLGDESAQSSEVMEEGSGTAAKAKPAGVQAKARKTAFEKEMEEKLSHPDEIMERFHHYLPRLLLLCLPLFAGLSLFVFRGSGLTYLQHLVWALHLHTFYFLFHLVSSGWVGLLDLVWPTLATVLNIAAKLYLVAYVYLAVRYLFRTQRKGTIFRGLFLTGAYGFVLLLGVAATFVLALWLD